MQAQNHQWTELNTNYTYTSCLLEVPSPNVIYGLDSGEPLLIRSFDAGSTWDSIKLFSDSSTGCYYRDFQFINDSVGFIWGHFGGHHSVFGTNPAILKTTNRGQTWNSISTSFYLPHGSVNALHFVNENYGVAYVYEKGHAIGSDSSAYTYITTNGGYSWSSTPIDFNLMPQKNYYLSMTSSLLGYATGDHSNLFYSKTIDGGQTWQTQQLNSLGGPGTNLKFIDDVTGVITAKDSILYTSNGGSTWGRTKISGIPYIMTFELIDATTSFFAGYSKIYFSNDNYQSWTKSFDKPGTFIRDMERSGNKIYVSTYGNKIYSLDLTTVTLPEYFNQTIKGFSIFPNPTHSTVSIRLNTPIKTECTIQLFDITGNNVGNYSIAAGETCTIPLHGYSKGLYFCILKTSGQQFVEKLTIN